MTDTQTLSPVSPPGEEESQPLLSPNKKPARHAMGDAYIRPLIFLVYLSVFSGSFISAMATAFFPQVAKEKFGIGDSYIGIVFAVFPAVVALSSPLVAYCCNSIGRMPVMIFGMLFEIGGLTMFGLSSSTLAFCVSRVISGLSAACMSVSGMAMLVSNVTNLNDALGVQEVLSGMGFVFGAPVGGLLYSWLGFRWVFFANAILFAVVLVYASFEWRFNLQKWEEFEAEKELEESEGEKDDSNLPMIPISKLMNRVVVPCACSCSVLFLVLGSTEPILAPHIQRVLNLEISYVGLMYSVPSIVYALSAGMAGSVSRILTGKTTLVLGLFLLGISMILIGPAPYFDQIASTALAWVFLMIGFLLLGVGLGFGFVPGVPLIRDGADYVVRTHKGIYRAEEKSISNFVSAVFNSFGSIGQVLGPLSAGFFMEYLPHRREMNCQGDAEDCMSGFQWTVTIYGALSLVTSILIQVVVPNHEKEARRQEVYQVIEEEEH